MSWAESLPPLSSRGASGTDADTVATHTPERGPVDHGAAGADQHEVSGAPQAQVMPTLQAIAERRAEARPLADRLAALQQLLSDDLAAFEGALAAVTRQPARVQDAAFHLLDQGGKRLRPICVLLAAKLGGERGRAALPTALDLAVGAELVHNATLLHDDVVDLGDTRRGAEAARLLFGNASSVFAGDWLLVQALKRVRRANVADTFDTLLEVIEAMIMAESIQLDARGTLTLTQDAWLRVVEGKTAALFRWAMRAGGQAGGLPEGACDALADFGQHLGVAFQAIDDVLDLSGDPSALGKDLFADLREGKMTWPMIVGFERDASLRQWVEQLVSVDAVDNTLANDLATSVSESLHRSGALADCRAMAEARVELAIASLQRFEANDVTAALEAAAHASVERAR